MNNPKSSGISRGRGRKGKSTMARFLFFVEKAAKRNLPPAPPPGAPFGKTPRPPQKLVWVHPRTPAPPKGKIFLQSLRNSLKINDGKQGLYIMNCWPSRKASQPGPPAPVSKEKRIIPARKKPGRNDPGKVLAKNPQLTTELPVEKIEKFCPGEPKINPRK